MFPPYKGLLHRFTFKAARKKREMPLTRTFVQSGLDIASF